MRDVISLYAYVSPASGLLDAAPLPLGRCRRRALSLFIVRARRLLARLHFSIITGLDVIAILAHFR